VNTVILKFNEKMRNEIDDLLKSNKDYRLISRQNGLVVHAYQNIDRPFLNEVQACRIRKGKLKNGTGRINNCDCS
jgi:hypothetical protein